MRTLYSISLLCALTVQQASAYQLDSVVVRVIDTGPGLATVTRMPGGHYMVYDAGYWTRDGEDAFDGIADVIPTGEEIDLLVLSHSDSDHQGAVKRIFDAFPVKKVIRGGLERVETATWTRADSTIDAHRVAGNTMDINLKYYEFPPGATYRFGDVFVTFVAGFYVPPDDWDVGSPTDGEFRNAGSVVIRLQYAGRSILFTGDAVGRHSGGPDTQLIATEKYMIENSQAIPVDSDILIAPHHGADNGSSTAFINAVSPEWVIFSAGHRYGHPCDVTAQRYLSAGVPASRLLRTDIGDGEGDPSIGCQEWDPDGNFPASDPAGDDDIELVIRADGSFEARYRDQ